MIAKVLECPEASKRGLRCYWHGRCSGCGEMIHLAEMPDFPGWESGWDVDADEMALATVGDPPRCFECRGGPM